MQMDSKGSFEQNSQKHQLDPDTWFQAEFQKRLQELYKFSLIFNPTFHLAMFGETGKTIHTLEDMLEQVSSITKGHGMVLSLGKLKWYQGNNKFSLFGILIQEDTISYFILSFRQQIILGYIPLFKLPIMLWRGS